MLIKNYQSKILTAICGLLIFPLATFAKQNPDILNQWVKDNLNNAKDTNLLYQKAHEALAVSAAQDDDSAVNEARRNLSLYHENFGWIDSSIYFMEKIRDYYSQVKDTGALAETYLEIRGLYSSKAEYAKAEEQVFDALRLYEKTSNKKGLANCYTALCDLLYYEDKYQESVDYCDKAIAIQKEIDARVDLAVSLRYKAASQLFSGADLEDALATINQSIEILSKIPGEEIQTMASMNGRGNIYKYMERYDDAFADYRSNYEQSLSMGLYRYVIPSIANIGHVLILQEKYQEALPYTLDAIDIMKESGDTKNLWENYMHAADIYEKLGNFEKANEYNKLYASAYADYLESIIDRMESEAQIKYESAQKDAMIQSQETTISNQKRVELLYIAIAVILLVSLAGMLRSRSRIRKKQKELEQSRAELQQSLNNLKSTQQQLIHAEKMASLGELTAGIAHEIQNPLNFVNNFSEVNAELIADLQEELKKGNQEDIQVLINDLLENEQKIAHHGKRADGIVKGMLQHSRAASGQKQPTDLNALADEYLRLSYHGLRAKDKLFNADFKLETDPDLPKMNVVPQDIGRVLLNLINNAFYAVSEKAKKNPENYKPQVIVTTHFSPLKGEYKGVTIHVHDNGPGIPPEIKDKIFQPFFTTKPTGEGTGLGLSLSYDIVTKGHGGEIEVESEDGQGTEFIIKLPAV